MNSNTILAKEDLRTLLSAAKPYYLPKYQRHFAWGVKQAEELFDDIQSANENSENFL